MLDERKAAILRAVVEEYIDTAQPVGSGHVAAAPGVDVSSATVRNEMATSRPTATCASPTPRPAGCPPRRATGSSSTTWAPARLQGRSAEEVRDFFARAHGEVEQMLSETSRLLSNLTNLTSVVVSPLAAEATLRSVQLVSLTATSALVVAVFSDGLVDKHTIELPASADERVAAAGAATSPPTWAAAAPGPGRAPRPPLDRATDGPLVAAAVDALTGAPVEDPEHVYVGGAARMAQAFDAIETVREVLGILEQQFVVVSLLRDVIDRGLHVAIGTETGVAPLAECALVVAPYDIEGERAGTIGVLGPTRMNYPQALAAVAVVSHRLSDRLTEG